METLLEKCTETLLVGIEILKSAQVPEIGRCWKSSNGWTYFRRMWVLRRQATHTWIQESMAGVSVPNRFRTRGRNRNELVARSFPGGKIALTIDIVAATLLSPFSVFLQSSAADRNAPVDCRSACKLQLEKRN